MKKTVQGKLGPGRLGPCKLGPALFGAQFAIVWQIGPLGSKLGPGKLDPGKLGPGIMGPSRLGPLAANWSPVLYIFSLDIFCQQLGEYMSVGFVYWYWIYSANN